MVMNKSKHISRNAGRFAYDGLERLLHERARLSILSSLAAHAQGLVFNDLKKLCALTDGNLSRQLQVLQEAGLIEIWKGQRRDRRPQTLCRMTSEGRKRFAQYVAELENVIADAMSAGAELVMRPSTQRGTSSV
jgi:DNA-binding MarR family transcriptional regulator